MALVLEKPALAAGASGAIYGLYGAYLYIALFRRHMLDPGSRRSIQIMLALGLIYSVAVSEMSFWGHVGGTVAGFFAARSVDAAASTIAEAAKRPNAAPERRNCANSPAR